MDFVPKPGDGLLPVTGTACTALQGHDVITLRLAFLSSSLQDRPQLSSMYAFSPQLARDLVEQLSRSLTLLSEAPDRTSRPSPSGTH